MKTDYNQFSSNNKTATELVSVRDDKTFLVQGNGSVGFSLRPGKARGGFPVHVYVDGSQKPIRVEGPGPQMQETPYQTLLVDCAAGGPKTGDGWYVEQYRNEQEAPRVGLPTDAKGILKTTSPGGRVLFNLNMQRDFETYRYAFQRNGGEDIFKVWVNPLEPTSFLRSDENGGSPTPMGKGFDLSAFQRVVVGVEMLVQDVNNADRYQFGGTTIAPKFSAVAPDGSSLFADADVANDLGGGAYVRRGLLHLGFPHAENSSSPNDFVRSRPLPPYGHFWFYCEALPDFLPRTDGDVQFNFWAVGY